jgi:hypothetical protein
MIGWLETDDGKVWPVDDYAAEGPRTQRWIVEGVVKHHIVEPQAADLAVFGRRGSRCSRR